MLCIFAFLGQNQELVNQDKYKRSSSDKDEVLENLINDYGGSNDLLEFKEKYYNKTLAKWVLGKKEPNQIVFDGENYIQKKYDLDNNVLYETIEKILNQ